MKINKQTLPRVLSFLVQCQIDCKKIGRAWSPSATESEKHVGHGCFNAANSLGYFYKADDGKWVCTINSFDLDHALLVVQKAYEYSQCKKAEREARGHIPKPRKPKSPESKTPEQRVLGIFDLKPKIDPEKSAEYLAAKAAASVPNPNPVKPNIEQPDDIWQKSIVDHLMKLNTQQFVEAFKLSQWITECRRRGFAVHLTFNSKIDL
jgi:hypothetical protein